MLSHVWLFVTLWSVAHQAPLWDFPGKNTGVGCHFLLQGSSPQRNWTHDSCISCIAGPLSSSLPDSYKRYVEKDRLISGGTNFSKGLGNLWVGWPTENMLLNLLFDLGILNTASLRFSQGATSIFCRGEILAGQLQLLNLQLGAVMSISWSCADASYYSRSHLLCSF